MHFGSCLWLSDLFYFAHFHPFSLFGRPAGRQKTRKPSDHPCSFILQTNKQTQPPLTASWTSVHIKFMSLLAMCAMSTFLICFDFMCDWTSKTTRRPPAGCRFRRGEEEAADAQVATQLTIPQWKNQNINILHCDVDCWLWVDCSIFDSNTHRFQSDAVNCNQSSQTTFAGAVVKLKPGVCNFSISGLKFHHNVWDFNSEIVWKKILLALSSGPMTVLFSQSRISAGRGCSHWLSYKRSGTSP